MCRTAAMGIIHANSIIMQMPCVQREPDVPSVLHSILDSTCLGGDLTDTGHHGLSQQQPFHKYHGGKPPFEHADLRAGASLHDCRYPSRWCSPRPTSGRRRCLLPLSTSRPSATNCWRYVLNLLIDIALCKKGKGSVMASGLLEQASILEEEH